MQDQQAFQALWASRFYLLYGALAGVVFALLLMVVIPHKYQAEMIVAPTNKTEGKDFSSLLPDADIPALQYFVQRIAGNSSTDFTEFETLMRTSRVAEEIFKNKIILAQLLPTEKQSVRYLRDYLQNKISIAPMAATAIRQISFRHENPEFAKAFLQILYDKTDFILKQDIHQRANKLITHLEQALVNTRSPDHRQALVTLLKEQEHLKLLTSIDVPYAAQLIEPPIVSVTPVTPNPWLLFPVLLLIGTGVGYVVFVVRVKTAL
jgi:LPS O-antigen subunit length determinant protein (WzzB/FepE family)